MYKLLIVDDERWVRERINYTIDWDKIGIEVIGEACDGEEALEMTERLLPDIVITDIRMPCIDGLEYIERLREKNIRTRVLIISGYSDFEYAQKAIKLGAFDFILKPVEDEDLIAAVKRCVEDLESEIKRDILLKKAEKELKESKALLKKEFLTNLVSGYFTSEEDIKKEMIYLDMDYHKYNNICFIIELDELTPESGGQVWDKHLLQFVMCNIAQDFLNKLGCGESFYIHTGEVICLIFSENNEKTLTRQVLSVSNAIKKMVQKVSGYSVTIGIGRTCRNFMGISTSYREAREALQYKAYLGKNKIYDIRSINVKHRPKRYKLNDLELLLNNIKMGNRENTLSILDKIVKTAYKENEDICPLDLKFLFMDIISSIFKAVLDENTTSDDFFNLSINFFEQLNRLQTVDEIYQWLTVAALKIIDTLEKYKSTRKRKIIEKAVEYIRNHYTEPITLNSIAEKLFMNESYFCKVFKEEMGESFTKYLINLRIQKAKELLADPTIKIYEVASMVGYDDVQYFTKIFKSIQGVTPMQYREKIK